MEISITRRAREFGYVFWTKKQDADVGTFLGNKKSLDVWLDDSFLGEKKIDWKYRRISLGYKQTRRIESSKKIYHLSLRKDGVLKIVCK